VGHVLAVDLPGFGHSEGRVDLFSPQAVGRFLVGLIDEWELGAPHVFGPDVGGPAALFAAAESPTSLTPGGGSRPPFGALATASAGERERAAARGSLLVVVGFRANRRARDAIAEIPFLASSVRDDEWVYEATATAPSVAAR
jgi:pimeloyl-ACP methyl ester carboxylesterase